MLFIQSSVNWHLGCFYNLAIVNNTAMNIRVHVFFQISVFLFFGYIPKVELLGHMVVLFLVFWRNSKLFFIVTGSIYMSPTVYKGALFSISSPMFAICRLFDKSHFDRCEISFCGFLFAHFSLKCWASFHVPVDICM